MQTASPGRISAGVAAQAVDAGFHRVLIAAARNRGATPFNTVLREMCFLNSMAISRFSFRVLRFMPGDRAPLAAGTRTAS